MFSNKGSVVILARDQDQYGWVMYNVLTPKRLWDTVIYRDGDKTHVDMKRMLQLPVNVSIKSFTHNFKGDM